MINQIPLSSSAQLAALNTLAQTVLELETEACGEDVDPSDYLFTLGVRPSGVVDLFVAVDDNYNSSPSCHQGYVYPNGWVVSVSDDGSLNGSSYNSVADLYNWVPA